MRLQKIKVLLMVSVSTASALTACGNTTKPLDTPIKVIEKAVMPPVPGELMVQPLRPNAPAKGTTQALLEHAVELGAYVGQLENQNQAWRLWATGGTP